MLDLLNSPFGWMAAFFVGIFFCAWRMDKAVERLGIKLSTEREPPPRLIVQIRNALVAIALVLAILYLLKETSFAVALLVLLVGTLYYWREAYKSRVLPLVAAGLSPSEARVFTLMQLLWLGPLAITMALFAWSRYGAP